MLYGTSLSFCVRDIVEGRVLEDDVTLIFTNTKVPCPIYFHGTWLRNWARWEDVFKRYKEVFWKVDSKECVAVAKRLILSNKVVQPRLFGFCIPGVTSWVNDYETLRHMIQEDGSYDPECKLGFEVYSSTIVPHKIPVELYNE